MHRVVRAMSEHNGTACEEAVASSSAIQEQLERILKSKILAGSANLRALLSFIVNRTLEGKSDSLKEYSLGIEVFRRADTYDPRLDPIVRVQASNLRAKLRDYYAGAGANDPVSIELPRGSYVPQFTAKPTAHSGAVRYSTESASVAVLPCADLSPSHDHQAFCEGITEEIINALGKVKELKVVGRASVFRFKETGQDVRAVGKELGVQTVLETSVRSDKSQLRIMAHLTDATTGFALWSKVFSFRMKEIFTVQEEIAKSIASALRVTKAPRMGLAPSPAMDIEIYNLYLLARYHLNRRTETGIRRALAIFSDLLEGDPANPQALSGLAECHFLLAMCGAEPPSEAMPRAAAMAAKALQVDRDLPDAHAALASVKALYEWDWAAAERGFQRALELHPNHCEARLFYAFAYLLPKGFGQEAIDQLRLAVNLDPLSVPANHMLAFAFYALRRYPDAIRQCDSTLDLDAVFSRAHALRSLALAYAGSPREAVAAAQHALDLPDGESSSTVVTAAVAVNLLAGHRRRALEIFKSSAKRFGAESTHWHALACAVLGQRERALRLLQMAFQKRDPWLVSLVYDPLADSLRPDPRFQNLLVNLGLTSQPAQISESA
jgi:TolB-like protein/Tfp pilus assembly protein PilF